VKEINLLSNFFTGSA